MTVDTKIDYRVVIDHHGTILLSRSLVLSVLGNLPDDHYVRISVELGLVGEELRLGRTLRLTPAVPRWPQKYLTSDELRGDPCVFDIHITNYSEGLYERGAYLPYDMREIHQLDKLPPLRGTNSRWLHGHQILKAVGFPPPAEGYIVLRARVEGETILIDLYE